MTLKTRNVDNKKDFLSSSCLCLFNFSSMIKRKDFLSIYSSQLQVILSLNLFQKGKASHASIQTSFTLQILLSCNMV